MRQMLETFLQSKHQNHLLRQKSSRLLHLLPLLRLLLLQHGDPPLPHQHRPRLLPHHLYRPLLELRLP